MQPAKTSQLHLGTDPMAGCMHLNIGPHNIWKSKHIVRFQENFRAFFEAVFADIVALLSPSVGSEA